VETLASEQISSSHVERHPKGTCARILLSSVFGPYAQDDEFGSRSINPMELYHNQVTRAKGSFSLRMFHRSWGIMLIQANISAPCAVLDFPIREDFAREITAHLYDIIGISSIIVNVAKVREMCRMIRTLSPTSTIVVGGHVTAIPGIENVHGGLRSSLRIQLARWRVSASPARLRIHDS
jgi:B12 binding domain